MDLYWMEPKQLKKNWGNNSIKSGKGFCNGRILLSEIEKADGKNGKILLF
jgi:hypothetical protein